MITKRVKEEESQIERNVMMKATFCLMNFNHKGGGPKPRLQAATRSLKKQKHILPQKPPEEISLMISWNNTLTSVW